VASLKGVAGMVCGPRFLRVLPKDAGPLGWEPRSLVDPRSLTLYGAYLLRPTYRAHVGGDPATP